ncbi:hypothetical protein HA466_0283080 [Hirschfeldia incana]|nr:hypothetical protein HA466_0283080 [Hirschfeldia incana]
MAPALTKENVKAAESLALEPSQSSTVTGETASAPSNQQLTAAYIGMATNVDAEPKESSAASLRRHFGVDGRLTTVKDVVTGLKDSFSGLKQSINMVLKMNGVDPITR